MQNPQEVKAAAQAVRAVCGEIPENALGLVVGTGLAGLAQAMDVAARLPFAAIPHMPLPGVESHRSEFVLGHIGPRPVLAALGRVHLYEGHPPAKVCLGVRLMAELGVKTVILTNASGGLNPALEAGSLMAVADQINSTGQSALTGPNHDPWGPRFPDMGRIYPARLREIARNAAAQLGFDLPEGVYLGLTGPNLETPAEVGAYRTLGADALGMSTVLEAQALAHMNVPVLGLSCVTNVLSANEPGQPATIEAVIAAASRAAGRLGELIREAAPEL